MAALPVTLNAVAVGGGPAAGALAFTYRRATTTPLPAYQDVGLTIPTLNPVVADADGRFVFYLDDTKEYSVQVRTSDRATVLYAFDVVDGFISITYAQIDQLTLFEEDDTADGAQTHVLSDVAISNPWSLRILFDGIEQPVANYSVITDGTDSTVTYATNCQPALGVRVLYKASVFQALSPEIGDFTGVDLGTASAIPADTGLGGTLNDLFAERVLSDGGDASATVVTPTGGASPDTAANWLSKIPNVLPAANLAIASGVATPTKTSVVLQAESGTTDTVTSIDASAFPDNASGELEVDAGDEIVFEQGVNLKTETGYNQYAQAGERLRWLRDGSTIYINRILTRNPDLHSSLFGVKLGIDNHDRIEGLLNAGMETGKRVVFEAPETPGQQYLQSSLSIALVGHLEVYNQPGVEFGFYAPEQAGLFNLTGVDNTYDIMWRGGRIDTSGGIFKWVDASNSGLGIVRARALTVEDLYGYGGPKLAYAQPADFSVTTAFPITKVEDNGSGQPRFTCSMICSASGGMLDTGHTLNIWGATNYASGPHTITRINDDQFDITALSYVAEMFANGDALISTVDVDVQNYTRLRAHGMCDAMLYPSGQGVAGYDEDDDGRICNITDCYARHCGEAIAAKRELGLVTITGGGAYDCIGGLSLTNAGTPTQPARRLKLNNYLIKRTDYNPIVLRGFQFDIGTGVEIDSWGRRRGATSTVSQYGSDPWIGAAIAVRGASDVLITQPRIKQGYTSHSSDKGIHVENTTINSVPYTAGGVSLQGGVFDNVHTPISEASGVSTSQFEHYTLRNIPSSVERITLTNSASYAYPSPRRSGTVSLTPFLSTVNATSWTSANLGCDWEETEPGIIRLRARIQTYIATLGSGSGEFRLSGFPFAAFTDATEGDFIPVFSQISGGLTSVPANTTQIWLGMLSGQAACRFYFGQPNGNSTAITATHLVVGSPVRFEFTGFYKRARPLVLS